MLGYIYTQWGTTIHRFWVFWYMSKFCVKLMWRAIVHDLSKYRHDEAEGFARTIFNLKHTTYGSTTYKSLLRSIEPNLKLHYQRNSHHPEHYNYWECNGCFTHQPLGNNGICGVCGYTQFTHRQGIAEMDVLDKIEMVVDWRAATKRHKDGDIIKSLEKNKDRFKYNYKEQTMFYQIVCVIDKGARK